MDSARQLIAACAVMALLVFVVGMRMLLVRVLEMRARRLRLQDVATSVQVAAQLQAVQAADNFRNLFEVPVLFYALVAMALAVHHVPPWLVTGAWIYVGLRVLHSLIHCSYNRVAHRFTVFAASFGTLVALWLAFAVSLIRSTPG
jgi:hypothetical protein